MGDVQLATNGAEYWVTLGGRTFAPGEAIDNFEFAAGTCIANRHFHRYEHVELVVGGEKRSYTFDLKQMVGWRWYGIRPYLRITDTVTGRERFFLCFPFGMFESMWAELTVVTNYPPWLAVGGQLQMIRYLVQDTIVLAVLYWLPLQLAAPRLIPAAKALLRASGLTFSD
ncbi:MAG: hypothetical protein L0228_09610 [Planctomycetes bacterium]|nr:hypothetical protein [Planctomycetota bacterium]